jgi:hypothetical protein
MKTKFHLETFLLTHPLSDISAEDKIKNIPARPYDPTHHTTVLTANLTQVIILSAQHSTIQILGNNASCEDSCITNNKWLTF